MEKLKKQDCKPLQSVTEKVITFELLSTLKLSRNLLSLAICITKHISDFLHLSSSGFSPPSTFISCSRQNPLTQQLLT